MKTAEELRTKAWDDGGQWAIFRKGTKDNIVVLICNPPCGRCRSPFVSFKIYKDGVEVDTASNYYEMRRIVNKLTFHMNEVDEE